MRRNRWPASAGITGRHRRNTHSGGTRGKFYQPGATLNLPVYLDAEVQDHLARLANAKGIDFSALVNAMLRKDLELIDIAK